MHIEIVHLLDDARMMQACELYADSFRMPPWNENWTLEATRELISGYLQHGWLCCLFVEDELRALSACQPLRTHHDARQVVELGVNENACWYADWVTRSDCWGRGYGRTILRHSLEYARKLNFPCMASRTKIDNYSALHIFNREGFNRVAICPAETGGVVSMRQVLVHPF